MAVTVEAPTTHDRSEHAPGRELTSAQLTSMREDFSANPVYRLSQNALTHAALHEVAIDRQIVNASDHSMSTLLDDWKVTNQKNTGRCWLFAGLNLLRADARKKLNLKDFELSQNWMMFWDKLERANYTLEAFIDTADRAVDDRTVAHLLTTLAEDGGQWNMFVALVRKHGIVPKQFMPETKSCTNTGEMNGVLQRVLRHGAKSLREAATTRGVDAARAEKDKILRTVHRVLCIHLGSPPEAFDWQWSDKDRVFHRDGMLTPVEFTSRYVGLPLDDYVCLVHDPRPSSPLNRTFTVEYLGNVVGAPPVTYLNVPASVMKELAARALTEEEPVWFGCDTDQMSSDEYGLWDANLYDLESLYGARFSLEKPDRLLYGDSRMTHAMLFTGVDQVDGVPRRWRVENSWGKKPGKDGFYTMNDSWFDEYVFEVAVRRQHLSKELQGALDSEPIVLPAWDPMGSLAR